MTTIETHSGTLTDELAELADSHEFKPYYFVNAAPEGSLETLLKNQLTGFLRKCEDPSKAALFVAKDDSGKPLGFCGAELLDFDTAVLKVNSGRIPFFVPGSGEYNDIRPVADQLMSAAMDWLKERDVVFTNIRAAVYEMPLIHAAESAGFNLMDNGITVIIHQDNAPKYEKAGYDIRLFAGKDIDIVREIMRDAYTHDRFHLDPKIPHEAAEELYQLWIHHCCVSPRELERVLIAERKGVVKGFFQYHYEKEFSQTTGMGLYTYGPAAVVRDRTAIGAYYSLLVFAIENTTMLGAPYAMVRIPIGITPILKLVLKLPPSFMGFDMTYHHWR